MYTKMDWSIDYFPVHLPCSWAWTDRSDSRGVCAMDSMLEPSERFLPITLHCISGPNQTLTLNIIRNLTLPLTLTLALNLTDPKLNPNIKFNPNPDHKV